MRADKARGRRDTAIAYGALHDIWIEATAIYWERRARQLEASRPRTGDFIGQASRTDLLARWDRLNAAAAACRARASIADLAARELDEAIADTASGAAA